MESPPQFNILYYSNKCKHSKHILDFVAKNGFGNEMECICVDKRVQGKTGGGWVIQLEDGKQHRLPPNIDRVPALLLVKQKYQVRFGGDIHTYLQPVAEKKKEDALQGAGEPIGFETTAFSKQFSKF